MLYDVYGTPTEPKYNGFEHAINYTFQREPEYNIFYTVIRIPQKIPNGNKQYPFVYYPNYPNGRAESAYELNQRKNFLAVFNAGPFNTSNGLPSGTIIQNSQDLSVNEAPAGAWERILTIDNNGVLGYAALNTSASTLINNGVVSACTGFFPLIVDFKNVEDVDNTIAVNTSREEIAQRIAICQYDDGDYAIIATESRGYRSGSGNTSETLSFKEFQQLIKKHGVKFAFALDGGGSMEMVVGKRQLNPFYDNTYGRKVPTYIVFNGTTEFPAI